jgi:predicted nucleic acid-binding protein
MAMKALFDSDVLIDHLVGEAKADTELRRAVRIRRGARIKLPDAIIWASARTNGALLMTRNTKDYPKDDPFVRVPYSI